MWAGAHGLPPRAPCGMVSRSRDRAAASRRLDALDDRPLDAPGAAEDASVLTSVPMSLGLGWANLAVAGVAGPPPPHPDLLTLGLDRMPPSWDDLRTAYRTGEKLLLNGAGVLGADAAAMDARRRDRPALWWPPASTLRGKSR
jgi:hypothetical protein